MATKSTPQTLKGFRDLPPEKMRLRNKVVKALTETFQAFGFAPVQTPTLEYQETLLGKYGQEADRLVYTFEDKGGREVGLIYDLTVPISRFIAMNPTLPKPFKRYQIQNVFRADKPQKGRYREFTQCDVDSFGSPSPLADAEIIAVLNEGLKKLRLPDYKIRINSRQVLFQVMRESGIDPDKEMRVIQTIDKLDKKPKEEVLQELKNLISTNTINYLFDHLENAKPDANLEKVLEYAGAQGVTSKVLEFDPHLARGLDYYTGPIFEVTAREAKLGSLAGGGRYDQLISSFTGHPLPATGATFGLDRICDYLETVNFPLQTAPETEVLVTIFRPDLIKDSLKILNTLRSSGVRAEIYLNPEDKLQKQLRYADRKKLPFVVIAGPEELNKDVVKLRNMKSGEQKEIPANEITPSLL